jgi:hypothetical protein
MNLKEIEKLVEDVDNLIHHMTENKMVLDAKRQALVDKFGELPEKCSEAANKESNTVFRKLSMFPQPS